MSDLDVAHRRQETDSSLAGAFLLLFDQATILLFVRRYVGKVSGQKGVLLWAMRDVGSKPTWCAAISPLSPRDPPQACGIFELSNALSCAGGGLLLLNNGCAKRFYY